MPEENDERVPLENIIYYPILDIYSVKGCKEENRKLFWKHGYLIKDKDGKTIFEKPSE